MIPIQELLNKIKYSPKENPSDFVLFYYDRIEDKLKELRFVDIDRIEGGFLVLLQEDGEINIPLHRIKRVKKAGKIIWER